MNNTAITSAPAKKLLSKTTVMTLSVSFITLALIIFGRGISAMFNKQKLSVCYSLYQWFGSDSIGLVNIVTSTLTAAILVAVAFALIMSRSGSRAEPASAGGLSFLKITLAVAIIYTSIAIIVSFASVGVINYTDIEGYNGKINYTATGLFWLTIVLGTAILCCEIAFIRFSNSLTTNLQTGNIAKKGTFLIFAAAILGFIASLVNFCSKLYKLVSPPANYIDDINADKKTAELTNAEMLLNTFNVLIFAALLVIFVCLIILAGSYAMHADDILRGARTRAYSRGHEFVNPEDIPDYTGPENYNYNQSPNFVPYYNAKKSFDAVNRNIYTGEVPPIPATTEMSFKPKTQYPKDSAAAPAPQAGRTNPDETLPMRDPDATVPVNPDSTLPLDRR